MTTDTKRKMITSVKLPSSIEKKMLERVVGDGYKLRGKSKWIIEAIEAFLEMPEYHDLVDIAQDIDQLDTTVSIRIPEQLMDQLDKAITEVRKHYPNMEGVKSNIIRASILQKLIQKN